jgi:rod shape-determining protein MreC
MAGARRASRRRYVLLVIVLTCVTLITLDTRNGRSGPIGALGRIAHRIVSPVQGAVDDVAQPVSDWWNGVTDSGHLKRENRRLVEENARLRGKETQADEAIKENSELKKSLDLHDALLVKNVTGLIVGRDPGNFDPTLTIDKGSEAGIAVDMPVMAPEGIVGKVIEVWPGGAKIPTSRSECRHPVMPRLQTTPRRPRPPRSRAARTTRTISRCSSTRGRGW